MDDQAATLQALKDMPRPELFFTFPPETGKAPLKMTYGLEMDIRRMLPDPQTAMALLMNDPFTQDYVIRRCLTDKNQIITDPEADLIKPDQVDLDGEVIERMLMWAAEHALYFFAKRTTGLANLSVQFQAMMPAPSVPLPNGSSPSTSEMPSVGDSTA
jgi:hypothetical protein